MSDDTEIENRDQAKQVLRDTLTDKQVEALVLLIRTAEVQGDYHFNGEESVYEDDVSSTLYQLAAEIMLLRGNPND